MKNFIHCQKPILESSRWNAHQLSFSRSFTVLFFVFLLISGNINAQQGRQAQCPTPGLTSAISLSTQFPFSVMPSRCSVPGGPAVQGDGRINVKVTGFSTTYKMELLASPNKSLPPDPTTNPLEIIVGETRTGQTDPIFTFYGLSPSVYYCVRVTDEQTGCFNTIDLPLGCLNDCPDIVLSGVSIIQLICPAIKGAINVTVTRPNGPGPNGMYVYFYRLFYDDNGTLKPYLVNGQPVEGKSGEPVLTLSNLPPDYYCVLVQDEHTACIKQIDIVILPCIPGQGCTPGYWKNHTGSWGPSGYSPTSTVEDVFDVPNSLNLDGRTLLQALQGGGGPGVVGAATILLRAATAALLNAGHPGVNYPRTEAQIIADVNAALASNNRNTILALATALDKDNNLGCSINAHGNVEDKNKKGERPLSSSITEQAGELNLRALPNPSYGAFNLQIEGGGSTDKISLRIMDMHGRVIELYQNVQRNQKLRIGNNYKPGIYFIELAQGATRKQIKIIKSK